MNYVKITNLIRSDGSADYKGLEIEKIVSGTQLYPETDTGLLAYFAYNGEPVSHDDVEVISDEDYNVAREDYERGLEEAVSTEEEIKQLKQAMAEIAETHEQEKTEMQLALAELAELVGGEHND